jgi:hypothetical protein
MQLCFSRELLEYAAVRPVRQAGVDPRFRWSVGMTTVEKKKAVIIVNDRTRFTCVLTNVRKKDLCDLEGLIRDGIREALLDQGFSTALVDFYLGQAGEAVITTTKGQIYTNRLEKTAEEITERKELLKTTAAYQPLVSDIINSTAVIIRRAEGKQYPYTVMNRLLEELAAEHDVPILAHTAYSLFIQFETYWGDRWRKVMVPPSITFRQLHYTIQILFDWDNDHLFEFIVQGPFDYYKVAPATSFDGIRQFFGEEESLSDSETTLEAVMDEQRDLHMYYRWDFGDDLIHSIRVQRIQIEQELSEPELLFGFNQKFSESQNPFYGEDFYHDADDDEFYDEEEEEEEEDLYICSTSRINRLLKDCMKKDVRIGFAFY